VYFVSAKKRPELRIYLDSDLNKLVKTIATIREESISAVVAEALELWLQQPKQQGIIEKHNLDELD
jgi:predicted transcriptional regulator